MMLQSLLYFLAIAVVLIIVAWYNQKTHTPPPLIMTFETENEHNYFVIWKLSVDYPPIRVVWQLPTKAIATKLAEGELRYYHEYYSWGETVDDNLEDARMRFNAEAITIEFE